MNIVKYPIKKYLIIGAIASAFYLIVKNIKEVAEFLGLITSAVYPLVLGFIISYILFLILKPIEKIYFPKSKNKIIIKSRRPVCILLSFLLIMLFIAGILVIVLPEIINTCTLLIQEIPEAIDNTYQWIMSFSNYIPALQNVIPNLESLDIAGYLTKFLNVVIQGTEGMITSAVSFVSVVIGAITSFVIAVIFAVYMLFGKEKFVSQIEKFLYAFFKIDNQGYTRHVLSTANKTFSSFIFGQCIEAFILGALCVIGMLIFRFPYAVMTGTVVGVTALIPIVGAFMGAIVGAFMISTVDPMQAIFFLIFLIILMQIEGNLIYPKVVGNSIGLPGIWVLAAVTIGGSLFGIVGMLIGVPLAATIYKLLRESVNKRLVYSESERRGEDGGVQQ